MNVPKKVASLWGVSLFFAAYLTIIVLAGNKTIFLIGRGTPFEFHFHLNLQGRQLAAAVLGNPIAFLEDDLTPWTWWDGAAFLLLIPLVFLGLGIGCRALCRHTKRPTWFMSVAGAVWLATPFIFYPFSGNFYLDKLIFGALAGLGGVMIGNLVSWKHGLNVISFIVLLIAFAKVMWRFGGAITFFSTEFLGPGF